MWWKYLHSFLEYSLHYLLSHSLLIHVFYYCMSSFGSFFMNTLLHNCYAANNNNLVNRVNSLLVSLPWYAIINLAIPVTKYNLPGLGSNLVSNATSNIMNRFERKISGKGAVRVPYFIYFKWRHEGYYYIY